MVSRFITTQQSRFCRPPNPVYFTFHVMQDATLYSSATIRVSFSVYKHLARKYLSMLGPCIST
uniref:Uncharacterized protein n=1 Tax=Solanum lycopersicum TaxID=4081 RepID=K4C4W3_SOLLC